MNKLLKFFALSALVLCIGSIGALAVEADPIIRAGLSYGSSAVESANLSYENGTGYNIGYFNPDYSLASLFSTNVKRITISKTGSSNRFRITNSDSGDVLYEYDNGGSPLGIETFTDDGTAPSTWHRNEIYYGAFSFSYASGTNITVVNVARVQDYVKGVVPYEINPKWAVEAQKTQALCAKNYAVANLNRHRSDGFDVCNTIHCQVYRGIREATDLSNGAVDAIYGQYILYNNEIISAYYHSSNGGSTESAKNVWGTEVPYLQPVKDDYENITAIPNGTWRREITLAEITKVLQDKGETTSSIAEAYVEEFTPAGNVYKLTFVTTGGQKLSYTGEKARIILGSHTISQRYTISGSSSGYYTQSGPLSGGFANTYAIGARGAIERITQQGSQLTIITSSGKKSGSEAAVSSSSTYVIEGRGYGHNVGMSQYGAKGMAEAGFTYDQIIKHYFTGVEIAHGN